MIKKTINNWVIFFVDDFSKPTENGQQDGHHRSVSKSVHR